MSFLIEKDGKQQFIGHDPAKYLEQKWTIIGEGDEARPDDPEAEWADGEWLVPLAVIQRRLWARVKELRDANEFGIVTTPYGPLQADERSQGRLTRAVAMAEKLEARGQMFGTRWRLADNSHTPLIGRTQLEELGLMIGAQANHAFRRSDELWAQIFAPDVTREQLDVAQEEVEAGWDAGKA